LVQDCSTLQPSGGNCTPAQSANTATCTPGCAAGSQYCLASQACKMSVSARFRGRVAPASIARTG
jgi:hypothetical protein